MTPEPSRDDEVARLAIEAVLRAKCRTALISAFLKADEDPDEVRINSLAAEMADEMQLVAIDGELFVLPIT